MDSKVIEQTVTETVVGMTPFEQFVASLLKEGGGRRSDSEKLGVVRKRAAKPTVVVTWRSPNHTQWYGLPAKYALKRRGGFVAMKEA